MTVLYRIFPPGTFSRIGAFCCEALGFYAAYGAQSQNPLDRLCASDQYLFEPWGGSCDAITSALLCMAGHISSTAQLRCPIDGDIAHGLSFSVS